MEVEPVGYMELLLSEMNRGKVLLSTEPLSGVQLFIFAITCIHIYKNGHYFPDTKNNCHKKISVLEFLIDDIFATYFSTDSRHSYGYQLCSVYR